MFASDAAGIDRQFQNRSDIDSTQQASRGIPSDASVDETLAALQRPPTARLLWVGNNRQDARADV